MTTPADRVQRLREETAEATDGEWGVWDRGVGYCIRVGDELDEYDHPTLLPDGFRTDIGRAEDAAHIARWDPKAAEKVLDLVAVVIAHHSPYESNPVLREALAVLDALDPQEAT